MNVGKFRHKLTVQVKTVTGYGTRGEEVYAWSTQVGTWGEVRAMTGREQFNASQQWPDANVLITMHWVAGITTAMRVYDSCCSKYYNIKDVADPGGDRRWLRLTCKETV